VECPRRSHAIISAACSVCLALLSVPGCARTPVSPPALMPSRAVNSTVVQAPPAKIVGTQGFMAALIPGLAATKAPAFVRLGLQLTYRAHTATVAGMGREWKPDENGEWKTDDGQRWTPGEKRSGAAEGFTQFDVTALTANEAAVLASFYLVGRPGAAPSLSFQYPIVGPASFAGGLWVPPDQLRALKNRVSPDLKVQRMPCTVGGVARPAVWIQSLSDRGNSIYVYDVESGVLLHDATASTGAPSKVIGRDETSNTASTTLADGTLVNMRVVERPWDAESAAGWARSASEMIYGGTSTVPTAGGAPLVLRQDMSITPKDRGVGWVLYGILLRTSNSIGMPPTTTPSEAVSGLGQFGGAWLPPAALGRLAKGQRLDHDPVTGIDVVVTEAGDQRITITSSGKAQTLRWGYDRATGAMISMEKDDHNPYAPIRTRVTLQSGR
jgi:hypothetical protein